MEKETIVPKDFKLSKVKLQPTGGVQVEYKLTQIVENEASVLERKETCSRDIHPDLRELFEQLRSIVARAIGLVAFVPIMDEAPAEFREKLEALRSEMVQRVDVRGVAWSGVDEGEGVVITAVLETPNGLKTCIKTPRIKLAQTSFGFEDELEMITSVIEREVYAYLYEGKQAQLSLFGDEPEGDGADPIDMEE